MLRKVAKDKHENIIYLRDFWNGENKSYIVMELCKGNLADLLEVSGDFLPQRLLLEMFSQVAKGLEYLHNTAGVCHRDLKPENGTGPINI